MIRSLSAAEEVQGSLLFVIWRDREKQTCTQVVKVFLDEGWKDKKREEGEEG